MPEGREMGEEGMGRVKRRGWRERRVGEGGGEEWRRRSRERGGVEREAGRGNLWLWWFVTRVDIYFMHLVIAEILIIQSTLCGFSCHFLGERSERESQEIYGLYFLFPFFSYTTFCSDNSLAFNSRAFLAIRTKFLRERSQFRTC